MGRSARTLRVKACTARTLAGSVLGDRIHYTRSVTVSLSKGEKRDAKIRSVNLKAVKAEISSPVQS